jgi:hypothetical protein
MSDIRLESALSKEFVLLLDVDEVDDVDDAVSSERRVLVLDKLEINMRCNPFCARFPRAPNCRKQRFPELSVWTARECAKRTSDGDKEKA